eukprot:TRINITY_DN8432_c0_g3_i1.p1 TRINITY_DN8432_c0_g3~~TRINITY_DN8432_c0_g3_i1.p1  ORF type:complete len:607 (-),score=87.91 TRINITY_DN8432_c0_g3_i1:312-1919(-)
MATSEALAKQFKKLQNGSDIRGVALPGVPSEEVSLTPLAAYFIACGFVEWLKEAIGKSDTSQMKVSLGRDPRLSGPALRSAVIAGLASKGVKVTDFGLCTTPAMFYSCVLEDYGFDGAIMMTASHLPYNRNGLKFFNAKGGLEKGDISKILEVATSECAALNLQLGNAVDDPSYVLSKALEVDPNGIQYVQFIDTYAQVCQDILKKGINHPQNYDKPLTGIKIVVDAGNGSGGFFANKVLQELGADTTGSQFLDPDGTFPNHVPNPEDKGAMEATIEAVKKSCADLGIVFDTDVDRSGIVDERGNEINRNRFIALMSSVVLNEHPGTTIVTDSVTSNGLADFIEAQGGKHYRYRKGYKNIIAKGIELNNEGLQCELMMETSGHGAMKENYFLDDGAYLAIKAIIEMMRRKLGGEGGLTEVLDQLREPVEAKEFRLNIQQEDFKSVSDDVIVKFKDWIPQEASEWQIVEPNYEGVRVSIPEDGNGKGWILLRASLHDPLLVMNAESEVEGGLEKSTAKVKQFFEKYQFPVDLSPFN